MSKVMKKRKNECLFCTSRRCRERVYSMDLSYDEVACDKHKLDLWHHSDVEAPGVNKRFVSSTGHLKRSK